MRGRVEDREVKYEGQQSKPGLGHGAEPITTLQLPLHKHTE